MLDWRSQEANQKFRSQALAQEAGLSLVEESSIKLAYKQYKVHLACQDHRRDANVEQTLSLSKMRHWIRLL